MRRHIVLAILGVIAGPASFCCPVFSSGFLFAGRVFSFIPPCHFIGFVSCSASQRALADRRHFADINRCSLGLPAYIAPQHSPARPGPTLDFPYVLRNVAIIAHVDHGKTTLVDQLFRQSGTFRDNQRVEERAMDSNDLEKERGITILAKCTSVEWEHDDMPTSTSSTRPATPISAPRSSASSHGRRRHPAGRRRRRADAADQVRHRQGAGARPRPIVVVNKIDRARRRPAEVLDEVFELFLALDASDEQLDFPTLYASGRRLGYAGLSRRRPSGT